MSFFDILRAPDSVTVQSEEGWLALNSGSGGIWQAQGIELTGVLNQAQQQVRLSTRVAVKRVQLRWLLPVALQLRYLGDHWERGYGDMEWRGMVPERPLPWYFATFDGQRTHCYGVKTGASAICFWQVDPNGVSLWLDTRCGNLGVLPGQRELLLAEIVSREGQEGENPFQAIQAFCRLMCANPVLPEHPVYGGNNWYYAYGRSSHQDILDDSKLIASLATSRANPPYMVIDDGWQQCHFGSSNGGPWARGNYLFPDMAGLAHQMKEVGVRPGIWFRPLLTVEKVPESWVLARERTFMNDGLTLDPSIPAVLAQVAEDIKRIGNWGFQLIKHDFSSYDIFSRWGNNIEKDYQGSETGRTFADRTKTTAEIIKALYQTIAQAGREAGNPLILGCNTVGHLAAGLFAIQRTGDDTSGRQWERTRKLGVNTLAFRMPQHNTFFAVDADCVGLTKLVPWQFNRLWLDLLARSGTPLFVSAAPDAVGKAQEQALRAAFEVAAQQRPPAEPLDWLDCTTPGTWLIDGEQVKFDWYGAEGIQLFS